jgi:hypothetical protein
MPSQKPDVPKPRLDTTRKSGIQKPKGPIKAPPQPKPPLIARPKPSESNAFLTFETLKDAIERHEKEPHLKVYGRDIRVPKGNTKLAAAGIKSFCLIPEGGLGRRLMQTPAAERNFYEILLPGNISDPSDATGFCDLYVDIDLDLTINELGTEDLQKITRTLLYQIKERLARIGISETWMRILTYDSSTNTKFSQHHIVKIIDPETLQRYKFRNNFHCGAFMRGIRNDCLDLKFMFVNATKKHKGQNVQYIAFVSDLAIYTETRLFRPPGCTKYGKNSFLKCFDVENWAYIPVDDDKFFKFADEGLVQTCYNQDIIPFDVMEENGRMPVSTSKVDYCLRGNKEMMEYNPTVKNRKKKKPKDMSLKEFYETTFKFPFVWNLFGSPNRQWNFVFQTSEGKETWNRGLFFPSCSEFTRRVINQCPASIHIGGVHETADKRSPLVQKEFVLDFDTTDMSSLRGNCCGYEKKCCRNCWILAELAIRIFEFVSTVILGCQNTMAVFSGAKGVHMWILDKAFCGFTSRAEREILYELYFDKTKLDFESNKVHIAIGEQVISPMITDLKERLTFDTTPETPQEFWKMVYPVFDGKPTTDETHAIKIPYSMNTTSRRQSCPLSDFSGGLPFG